MSDLPWNDNGPDTWERHLWNQSYGGTDRHVEISTSGLDLTVDIEGAVPGRHFVVIPGDDSGDYPQIIADETGAGSGSHLYAAPGTFVVIVSYDDGNGQTVVAQEEVTVA